MITSNSKEIAEAKDVKTTKIVKASSVANTSSMQNNKKTTKQEKRQLKNEEFSCGMIKNDAEDEGDNQL